MEEIGCHFKFEKIIGNIYHNTELMLSSGRNCLRYIIKERKITTLFLPYFLCESLSEVAMLENVNVVYYHIDNELLPLNINQDELNENSYLYLVNYYGLLSDIIDDLIEKYKYVIVDNTHDFFDKDNHCADVIYNYRKYFGVPDGACIVSDDLLYNPTYSAGKSLDKIIEMVSRDETGEFFHYPTFKEADKHFKNEDLRYMSNFTRNYLNAIDYNTVLKKRLENYRILLEQLSKYNDLQLKEKELSYMYPLLVDDGDDLRNYLKKNNIYAIKLWPNILWNGANSEEIKRVENMILLPIDQRYSTDAMLYMSDVIDNYFSKNKSIKKILHWGKYGR